MTLRNGLRSRVIEVTVSKFFRLGVRILVGGEGGVISPQLEQLAGLYLGIL